jgi:hypothetical protein
VLIHSTPVHRRSDANCVGNAATAIVDIARSTHSAGVFVIRTLNDRRSIDITATHRVQSKARCADSESRFLAIKKFSC